MESETKLAIGEISGKREEQGTLTQATRATNRVVLSPTYKMAPAYRVEDQEKDSQKNMQPGN